MSPKPPRLTAIILFDVFGGDSESDRLTAYSEMTFIHRLKAMFSSLFILHVLELDFLAQAIRDGPNTQRPSVSQYKDLAERSTVVFNNEVNQVILVYE